MTEKVVLFGKDKSLVGIVTEPTSGTSSNNFPAIIILNAGLLHRIGPNRLHVAIARKMATAGFFVLRFDFSGIGDSSVRDDNIPFEKSSISETQEAMDYLNSARNIEKFILIGICSGANVAFKTACRDPRVLGLVGINGFYLDGQEHGKLERFIEQSVRSRYYRKHLLNFRSWWRVLTGESNLQSIIRFLLTKTKNLLTRIEQVVSKISSSQEWNLLAEHGTDIFLIYSEGSSALDAFRLTIERNLSELESPRNLGVEVIKHSDHVFTLLWSQSFLVHLIQQWAQDRKRDWICD